MHDKPEGPIPLYKVPIHYEALTHALALVVWFVGLWLTVMGGGWAIFTATVWVLTSTSLA